MAIVITWSAGSTITVEGRENLLNLKDSVVAMFSHASNLDGFLMNAVSPIAFRYAGKKSLFLIPFLGWTSRWGFGYVAIDRRNRKNALKSLKDLASIVNEQGCSIAISPEGTRSTDGLLQEFKKGPFYLREDINKNIAPVIIFGAYELWPPGRLYATPGNVCSVTLIYVSNI
jgi:1-acyl-sn-glycerol-3-phosphate acyltransferase